VLDKVKNLLKFLDEYLYARVQRVVNIAPTAHRRALRAACPASAPTRRAVSIRSWISLSTTTPARYQGDARAERSEGLHRRLPRAWDPSLRSGWRRAGGSRSAWY